MRFGKKLALHVSDDLSDAPYLSHKLMKEAINKTVLQLRLYQSRVQTSEQAWKDGLMREDEARALPGELSEMQQRISSLDYELFGLVDQDIIAILQHVRASEAYLLQQIGLLQSSAIQVGVLVKDSDLENLEKVLPVKPESQEVLCIGILDLRMQIAPMEVIAGLEALSLQYNMTVDAVNRHSQYLEINVAGFRKLLKRHEKQIPENFRARRMPFFGFHQLVTRTSQQLLEVLRLLGATLEDAWERFVVTSNSLGMQCAKPPLNELKSFGAECQMVLEIRKQLKDHNLIAAPGSLYPKPGANIVVQAQAVPDVHKTPHHWSSDHRGQQEGFCPQW